MAGDTCMFLHVHLPDNGKSLHAESSSSIFLEQVTSDHSHCRRVERATLSLFLEAIAVPIENKLSFAWTMLSLGWASKLLSSSSFPPEVVWQTSYLLSSSSFSWISYVMLFRRMSKSILYTSLTIFNISWLRSWYKRRRGEANESSASHLRGRLHAARSSLEKTC